MGMCLKCGEEPADHPGPPRAAEAFHMARVVRELHRLRLWSQKAGDGQLAAYASFRIRELEELADALFGREDH